MSDTDLRARSASEIVDAAFALYRRNMLEYVMVTAIAYSPYIVATLLMGAYRPLTDPSQVWNVLPVMIVSILVFSLVGAVIAYMGSDAYLGEPPDVARTVRAVLPRFASLLGGMTLVSIVVFFSALLFLLPAIWAVAVTFAVVPIIVLEGRTPVAAIRRSSALSKGRKGHILGTMLLSWGIYLTLSIGITLLSGLLGMPILTLMITSVYAIFAYPIINLVIMLLYYDARIRAEGFDVEHMARGLSGVPTSESMNESVV